MSVNNEDEDINMDLQNEYGDEYEDEYENEYEDDYGNEYEYEDEYMSNDEDEYEEEYKYVYSKEFRETINKFILEGETIENLNKFKTFIMSNPDLNIPTINHKLLNNYYYYYELFSYMCRYNYITYAQWLIETTPEIKLFYDNSINKSIYRIPIKNNKDTENAENNENESIYNYNAYVLKSLCKYEQLDYTKFLYSLNYNIIENDDYFAKTFYEILYYFTGDDSFYMDDSLYNDKIEKDKLLIQTYLELPNWVISLNYNIDLSYNNDELLFSACENDKINFMKWLYTIHSIDILKHINELFEIAYNKNYLEILDWLIELYPPVFNKLNNYDEFKKTCVKENTIMVNYIIEKNPSIKNSLYTNKHEIFNYVCNKAIIEYNNLIQTNLFKETQTEYSIMMQNDKSISHDELLNYNNLIKNNPNNIIFDYNFKITLSTNIFRKIDENYYAKNNDNNKYNYDYLEIATYLKNFNPEEYTLEIKDNQIYYSIKLFHVHHDILYITQKEKCSVCYDKDVQNQFGCKHRFCISCIKEWLNYNNICPYCRHPIKDVYMIDYKPDLS